MFNLLEITNRTTHRTLLTRSAPFKMSFRNEECRTKGLDQKLDISPTLIDVQDVVGEAKSIEDSPTPMAQIQSPWKLAIITLSICLRTFLVALDTLIIGTAIPSITSQFHSLEDIAWYSSAYLLTTTALQPSFGKLYKLFNIKLIYLACVALFEGTVMPRSYVDFC